MSSNRYIGAAATIAQVVTVTITGDDATTTYKITINGKVVSVLGSGTGVNATATKLQTALAASTFPEFLEVIWTVNTATITGTAVTAGTPFTAASSVSGGTGTIGAVTTATANGSPNDWGNTANWSLGALPVSTDDVYFDQSSIPVYYGLDQHTVTLNSLNIAASYTGTIGLPEVNGSGSTSYIEYRGTYLQISATTVNIGYGDGEGSQRIKLNTGSAATTMYVRQMATSLEDNLEALQWKGTNVGNVVEVTRGTVGIAGYGGDTATVATLNVGYVTDQAGDAYVRCGVGTTLTTVSQTGGTLILNGAATTVSQRAGTLEIYGTGALTTLTVDGGECDYLSTGTITTLNVGEAGTFNVAEDMNSRTVTNCTLYAGATLNDPFGTITFTNPVLLSRCRVADVTIDVGVNRHLAPS